MVLIYFGMGCALIFTPTFYKILKPSYSIILGILFVAYSIFRAYRIFKYFRKQNNENN